MLHPELLDLTIVVSKKENFIVNVCYFNLIMQQFEVIGISQFRDHLKLVKPQLEVRSSDLLSNYIFSIL